MDSALFIQSLLYLPAIIAAVVITVVLYARSSRSAAYYALITCNSAVLAGLFLHMLELHAPNTTLLSVVVIAGLIVLSLTVFLTIQLAYTLVTRSRLPLLLQMISGAGALIVFFFIFNFLDLIIDADQIGSDDIFFRIYQLLPLFFMIAYSLQLIYALSRHLINITDLSFDRIMLVVPDTVFVFDRSGNLIDHNSANPAFAGAGSRDELLARIMNGCEGGCSALARAMQNPGTRAGGELEWSPNEDVTLTWLWCCQALKNKRGRMAGFFLLLSDITPTRNISQQLQRQNRELKEINRQLSNYAQLVEQYAGAATQQEVAAFIDTSVRQRLTASADLIVQALDSRPDSRKPLLQILINESRQALADIRALVGRLTG